jgi:hypothetical protein
MARRAEFGCRQSVLNVTIGTIEAASRLCAGESAAYVAPLHRPALESAKDSSTDAAKACIRGDVVQSDLPRISDCTHANYDASLDGDEDRVALIRYP